MIYLSTKSITFIGIIFVYNILYIQCLCPSQCKCNDNLLEVNCVTGNLNTIPITLNPKLKHLNLNNNKVKSITQTSLNFYSQLEYLSINKNRLDTLSINAFNKQSYLEVLLMEDNQLTSKNITNETLKGLSSLKYLNLRNNLLTRITENLFAYLIGLEELNLSKNQINQIDYKAFKGLKTLKFLNLRENKIAIIPNFAFVPSLIKLDLGLNSLKNVHVTFSDSFGFLNELQELFLDFSGVKSVSGGDLLPKQVKNSSNRRVDQILTKPISFMSTEALLDEEHELFATGTDLRIPSSKQIKKSNQPNRYINTQDNWPKDTHEGQKELDSALYQGKKLKRITSNRVGQVGDQKDGNMNKFHLKNLNSRKNLFHLSSFTPVSGPKLSKLSPKNLDGNRRFGSSSLLKSGPLKYIPISLNHQSKRSIEELGEKSNDILWEYDDKVSDEDSTVRVKTGPSLMPTTILPSLILLDLRGNQIESIAHKDLSFWSQLKCLDLRQNPLNCNCSMKWFKDIILNSTLSTSNACTDILKGIQCNEPITAHGQPLISFDFNQLCDTINPSKSYYNQLVYITLVSLIIFTVLLIFLFSYFRLNIISSHFVPKLVTMDTSLSYEWLDDPKSRYESINGSNIREEIHDEGSSRNKILSVSISHPKSRTTLMFLNDHQNRCFKPSESTVL